MPKPALSFSIVTPSLNQSGWLKLCVASTADQEQAVQHIVQDAGSTDGSSVWIQSDPRLEAWVEKDGGMYDAINRGLLRAKGDILAYLNCDEQYLPGALHKVAEFFATHPAVDIVFGNIIMVDENGEYLCHRKVQAPRLLHTWTCHLSTLSCAMFFRRKLIDAGGYFFDTSYRCGGDQEWMVRLLQHGVQMAALGEFTSVFTRTGTNLGRDPRAEAERSRLRAMAPLWVRAGIPFWVMHHRLSRLIAGAYRQTPFEFALFTRQNPDAREIRRVAKPVFRQTW
jgi:glycosyltransferase involved in cell wall biosynthesis